TLMMRAARQINSDRPHTVVSEVEALLEPGRKQTIACLGLSFKPNIDDMRESPAVDVVRLLAELADVQVLAVEPNAQALPKQLQRTGVVLTDALTAIDKADIVVLLVDHRQFNLIDPEAFKNKKLVDTRGLWTWRKARRTDARIEGRNSMMRPRRRSTDKAA
ncbi:MAG TPA: UDP binding domain-containing protein, partial [Devosia sp.]